MESDSMIIYGQLLGNPYPAVIGASSDGLKLGGAHNRTTH